MSTSAAKRQRVEATSKALSNPFRSPFKTVRIAPQTDDHNILDQSSSLSPQVVQGRLRTPSHRQTVAAHSRLKSAKNAFASPMPNFALNADPDTALFLREHRELEKQLRQLQEELNIAEQARKIEVGPTKEYPDGEVDGELLELIRKWREASRQAADELFTIVRDRVNRYGMSKCTTLCGNNKIYGRTTN
jgi:Swi5-dependent recombination DNA repair protein 1